MEKKYELIDWNAVGVGRFLNIIKILIEVPEFDIKVGDLGGFIDYSVINNQSINDWIRNFNHLSDRMIFDDIIYEDAYIYKNGLMKPSKYKLKFVVCQIENDYATFYRTKNELISVRYGYFKGPVSVFLKHVDYCTNVYLKSIYYEAAELARDIIKFRLL